MMKALVKEGPGASYVYRDVPVPAPVGDELLVKVGKVALCGSDIALYQWGEGTGGGAPPNDQSLIHFPPSPPYTVLHPFLFLTSSVAQKIASIPFTPGHEMVGEVRTKKAFRYYIELS